MKGNFFKVAWDYLVQDKTFSKTLKAKHFRQKIKFQNFFSATEIFYFKFSTYY